MSWLDKCYSRLLVDNHITDCRPEYMSRYSPKEYVRLVKLSGVEMAMVYSCDHNGNCYYPTKVGHMHAGLRGRDIFGEVVDLLDREGIVPVAYYTHIFHNDIWRRHPECRQHDISGRDRHGRYRYGCPNNPGTAEFHFAQMAEFLTNKKLRGIFVDMTFWPMICCCDCCREKFRRECGLEIPTMVDWENPDWVKFQRFRERSMAEYAARTTQFIRNLRPDITVTHQFSPVLHGWYLGQSSGIAEACDYCSGDFYGGKMQQRFAVKAFDAFTTRRPFEFMTSRCVSLHDHTSAKGDDELRMHALTTLANGGAYFFIDAINPDGTLSEKFYRTLSDINRRLEPFRKAVSKGLRIKGTVGIYFSMPSCVGSSGPVSLEKVSESDSNNMSIRRNAVVEEAMGMSRVLTELHIPYELVTERTIDWSKFDLVLVGNAAYLPADEESKMRNYVYSGGILIATGRTSIHADDGTGSGDFSLGDVLGVHWTGRSTGRVSYLSKDGERLFCDAPAPLVTAENDTNVLGMVNMPDFPPDDPESYASIHSNPPGLEDSGFVGMSEHRYGKGLAVYIYDDVMTGRNDAHRRFAGETVLRYVKPPVECANLPKSAELTLLADEGGTTRCVAVVNYQDDLPPVPLRDVKIRLMTPAGGVFRLVRVSDGSGVPFVLENGMLSFTVDHIDEAEFFEFKQEEK
ncbi:MAG: beta-galactosidase [Victivallaceae bacterium]|nr:beta-galactosidase [Victivallaceae bacterium]